MSSQTVRAWGLCLLSVGPRLSLGPSHKPGSEGATPTRPPLELWNVLLGLSRAAPPAEGWWKGRSLLGCPPRQRRVGGSRGGTRSWGRALAMAGAGARALEALLARGGSGPGQLQWGRMVLNVGTKMGSVTLLHGVRKTAEPEVSKQFCKGTLFRSLFSCSRNSPVKMQLYMDSGTLTSSEPRPSGERHFKTSLADCFPTEVTCR